MARVIAVCNQKGGVGKTTTAVNLGSYLALAGRRVLLVDFDPQANASSALGFSRAATLCTVYEGLLAKAAPLGVIQKTEIRNFDYVPSHPNLAGATVELLDRPEREYFLHKFLDPLRHLYNYILIDLPPSMSVLTVNGLVAADEVLIPVQCEYYGLEGLGQLLETVDLINKNLGRKLSVAGALITMYDAREHLSREVSKEVRRHFTGHVYDVEIPRAVALAEAPSFAKPVVLYAPEAPGAKAYERLAREVLAQERLSTDEIGEDRSGSEVAEQSFHQGEAVLAGMTRAVKVGVVSYIEPSVIAVNVKAAPAVEETAVDGNLSAPEASVVDEASPSGPKMLYEHFD